MIDRFGWGPDGICAGDSKKDWIDTVIDWFIIDEDVPHLGHSDFYGADMFDFTAEDHGLMNNAVFPWATYKHFRSPADAEEKVQTAIDEGNLDDFKSYMHDFQDCSFHYEKGYRAPWGHMIKGVAPDNDINAWKRANERTEVYVKKWLEKWGKPPKNADCPNKCKQQ